MCINRNMVFFDRTEIVHLFIDKLIQRTGFYRQVYSWFV